MSAITIKLRVAQLTSTELRHALASYDVVACWSGCGRTGSEGHESDGGGEHDPLDHDPRRGDWDVALGYKFLRTGETA